MPVDTKHPQWEDRKLEWSQMRDAVRGETAVKDRTTRYLPMPSGFAAQADGGLAYYTAYQTRSRFPEIVGPTILGMSGVITRKEIDIKLPDTMMSLWERATSDGLPLESFYRRIVQELLTTGRYGVLVDAPREGADVPYLSGYSAENIINWDDGGDFYVLDESGYVRSGFTWEEKRRYRVLLLDEEGVYQQQVYEQDAATEPDEVIFPVGRGNTALTAVPFTIIGARDVMAEVDDPPLMGVSRAAISMYQLSADYRWQLFMSGQETLFIINGDAPDTVGSGVVVELKNDMGQTPDAKYVGPSGEGIEAHRKAIQDEQEAAVQAGARLMSTGESSQESGEALRLRYTAQTASLQTVAQASAQGLEHALKQAATMMGLDPNEVVVKPPSDFVDMRLLPSEAEALVRVWQTGAISYETLYDNLRRGEIASTERTAEEELQQIDREQFGGEDNSEDPGSVILR